MKLFARELFVVVSPGSRYVVDTPSIVGDREVHTDRAEAQASCDKIKAQYPDLGYHVQTLDDYLDDLRSAAQDVGEARSSERF